MGQKKKKDELLLEINQHYEMWTEDNDKRRTRTNGWNDITDAYWGKLPDDWPYITRIVDPRIRTSLIEKNGRLINSKLRGRLIPREEGDILGASLSNSILEYQWDNANDGGSMLVKIGISDLDARLYASKFAYVYWKTEIDKDGKVIFDGNELMPLDIRDCGIDPNSTHIENAKWFQLRTWEHLEDLKNQTDTGGKPIFKGLGTIETELRKRIKTGNRGKAKQSARRNEWVSRIKQLKGLEDRMGEDMAFPVIMIVTEYRRDRWITFAPEYDLVLRDIPNPYDHGKIPVAQLRYYPLQDDPLGESEVEPVLPLWLAIQANLCSYMDEVILKMRPPLKIIENQARIETIEYAPEAQWLVDRQDAVMEMTSSGNSIQFFQTTHAILTSEFNVAMGDLSQGVSQFDPFAQEKRTATEIKATVKQQNVRDQKNQNDLAEFIKDIMMMWHSNNKQFLFTPERKEQIVRIIGKEKFDFFQRAGLADKELTPENARLIGDIVSQDPSLTDGDIQELIETAEMPKFPIIENPEEKDPEKIKVSPKMEIDDLGNSATVVIIPEDLEGLYDYIPDIKSMSVGAGEEASRARQEALALFSNNQIMLQLLAKQGFEPNAKEILTSILEDAGARDSERFFVPINEQTTTEEPRILQGNGLVGQDQGVPATPQAPLGGNLPQPVA